MTQRRRGRIIEVSGDQARVRFPPPPGCTACRSGTGCGIALLLPGAGGAETWLPLPGGARAGDSVVVSIDDATLARAALAAWLMPLAGMVTGAALAGAAGDVAAFAGLAAGLAAGYGGARLLLNGYPLVARVARATCP